MPLTELGGSIFDLFYPGHVMIWHKFHKKKCIIVYLIDQASMIYTHSSTPRRI